MILKSDHQIVLRTTHFIAKNVWFLLEMCGSSHEMCGSFSKCVVPLEPHILSQKMCDSFTKCVIPFTKCVIPFTKCVIPSRNV